MQEKFTFNIEAPRFEKKMIMFKEETETREHVVLKLLAYILFYDERLKIEFGIGAHYKPDLVIEGDHGVPQLWIDCGQITLRKIESISHKFRNTPIIIVKSERNQTAAFRKLAAKRIELIEKIKFVHFDKGFIAKIAESLQRSNDVTQWQVTDDSIGISFGDETFESTVHTL